MDHFIKIGLRFSIFLFAIFHLSSYFLEKQLLLNLLAISGFFILFFSCFIYRLKGFKIPLTLISAGVIITIISKAHIIQDFYGGLLLMRDVVGLLIFIPLIGWVLNTEPYIESVMSFAYKLINTSRKFYLAISSFTQIIAFFLLFGCIPMMYDFVNKMVGNKHGEALENFKGTALLRAFALSSIWVITIPSFSFVVGRLGASLWMTILQGFFMSLCGIIIAVIFSYFQEKRYGIDLTTVIKGEMEKVMDKTSSTHGNGNVLGFFLLFISLFGSIFILYAIWKIDLLILISIVLIVWTIAYFIWKRRMERLVYEAKSYVTGTIEKQGYQLSMMLGAGVMIYSINQTSFGSFIISSVEYMQKTFPSFNLLYLLPFIVLILGFIGLGPLTVMVLVAGILDNIALPYPPELIVLSITSGSVMSMLLSPFIMPVIVLSASNGLSGFKNGIKFNWKFALVFYIVVQVYIQVMLLF